MSLSLKQWRLAKEVSQEAMAKALGISKPTYQRWEANPDLMPLGTAKAAASYLDVPMDNISFFDNEAIKHCAEA